ncbi:hypothetical protein [Streptomyces oceani]|uniref:Uncharacterized protein n=1 Tax=Streptomyces oceani TaxID=1075402 RepID=A0A1E7KIV7_9ACTN|nr:hypothetical protein [Streptomyces oceani]OEV03898.1 hypothetical protein AN216_09645 [Streptomyces oceani]
MTLYDGFLMRNSLNDDGTVPSPGYPYYSPDIIAHSQVDSPGTFFSENYASDPNQPVQLGSRLNPVYVRARNLSENTLSGYFISVFRAKPSLFLRPSEWSGNPLRTDSGATSVALPPAVAPGEVGVGRDHFRINAIDSDLFCCVAMVSPTQHPTIPTDFATYSAYILWARNNQNVCGRNLNLVRDYANRSFERIDTFSNPSTTDEVPTLFQVEVSTELPDGATFGLQCVPLGVSTNWRVGDARKRTASGITPAGFNGTVTTWVRLPAGTTWPPGASVDTSVWVGMEADDPAAAFATPLEELGVTREEVVGLPESGRLVRLGNCETLFESSASPR